MSLHELQPRLDGPEAEERLARMRKRFRKISRRASRAAHGKPGAAPTGTLAALLVSAACIGAAAFATAQAVLRPLLWP